MTIRRYHLNLAVLFDRQKGTRKINTRIIPGYAEHRLRDKTLKFKRIDSHAFLIVEIVDLRIIADVDV